MNCSSIEAVLSDKGNEACVPQRGAANRCAVALDQGECLCAPLPERDEQPARRRELLDERGRDLGTPRRDDDSIVGGVRAPAQGPVADRKSTRLNSSHLVISYAVFCLKKKNKQ